MRVFNVPAYAHPKPLKAHDKQEPVAYAAIANNSNIRIWTLTKTEAETIQERDGIELTPLYAHPAPVLEQEPFAWYVDSDVTFDQKTAESWKKTCLL